MDDLEPKNRSFSWANEFLKALAAHEVRHVVISPGSRSTPLTLAAEVNPDFKKHVILDERSAAYTALGIGKSTGRPAALICTSGTAAANYYPAVIESRQAGVPLLLLTADRPPKLRDIGANQAIDQIKLFGSYPVWFHEVGEPQTDPSDIRRLQRAAGQAVHYSCDRRGSSHLNFAFRKPLEPDPSFVQTVKESLQKKDSKPKISNLQSGRTIDADISPLKSHLLQAKRPVIIVGPEDPTYSINTWVEELALNFNIPLLAEPGSNIDCEKQEICGFAGFLRHFKQCSSLRPDLIIRAGQQPVSKALHRYIEEHQNVPHFLITNSRKLQDEQLAADFVYQGLPPTFESQTLPDRSDWWQMWKEAQDNFKSRLKQVFSGALLSDGQVIHHLIPQLPKTWSLVLSNSFPVRDAALFAGSSYSKHTIYVNRGASGIDGLNSTALGISIGHSSPTLLITGDLSFLHDTNALLNSDKLTEPVVIAIINNGGGSIFRMLPIAEHDTTFSSYFETPQDVNISAMAETYGISHHTISDVTELETLNLKQFSQKQGIHLLEFKTDPDQSMKERKKLWKPENQ